MIPVKPKKSLGQHFLTDNNIARKIVDSLTFSNYNQVLEIGPGMGVLSTYLLDLPDKEIRFVEIDRSSVDYLNEHLPAIRDKVYDGDVMHMNLDGIL